MKRSEVLEAAKKCVCGQREQDYGSPENNFETIGKLWGVYLAAAHTNWSFPINGITAKDVAVMMSLLKIARIATGSNADSFVDLAGYAACAGEIATQKDGAQCKPVIHCGDCLYWTPNGKRSIDPKENKSVRRGDCIKLSESTGETNGCAEGQCK